MQTIFNLICIVIGVIILSFVSDEMRKLLNMAVQWALVVILAIVVWGVPLLIIATIVKFCVSYLFGG